MKDHVGVGTRLGSLIRCDDRMRGQLTLTNGELALNSRDHGFGVSGGRTNFYIMLIEIFTHIVEVRGKFQMIDDGTLKVILDEVEDMLVVYKNGYQKILLMAGLRD